MGVVFAGMAASLDGFIASTSGDLSWLNDAMLPDEDYGFAETEKRTGAYVMGANTYREISASGMSGGGGRSAPMTYVVTHDSSLAMQGKRVEAYSGDLRQLVERIKGETDKDICLFGGGELVTEFINLGLVDELGVSVIPVLLGDGVRFFDRIDALKRLTLLEATSFPSGIVLLNYRL